jgi:hypothetical protein
LLGHGKFKTLFTHPASRGHILHAEELFEAKLKEKKTANTEQGN